MFYSFATYRYGSTNGQMPSSRIIVTGVADKKEAKAIALKESGAYKVNGNKVLKTDLEEYVKVLARIHPGMPVKIVSA